MTGLVLCAFRSAYHSSWDPTTDPVIGLTKQYLTSLEDVIEHVEDLVFIILGESLYISSCVYSYSIVMVQSIDC